MSSQSPFLRAAGVAAIAAAIAYAALLVLTIAGAGNSSPIGLVLFVAYALLSVVAYAGLYRVHRRESANLSLVALVAAAGGTLGGLLVDPSAIGPAIVVLSALFGLGALLFGFLGINSREVSRAAGVFALGTGGMALAMAGIALAGADAATFGMLNLVATLAFVAWFLAVAARWLRGPVEQVG